GSAGEPGEIEAALLPEAPDGRDLGRSKGGPLGNDGNSSPAADRRHIFSRLPHSHLLQGRCQGGENSQLGPGRRDDEEIDTEEPVIRQMAQVLPERLHREAVILADAEGTRRLRTLVGKVDQVEAPHLSCQPRPPQSAPSLPAIEIAAKATEIVPDYLQQGGGALHSLHPLRPLSSRHQDRQPSQRIEGQHLSPASHGIGERRREVVEEGERCRLPGLCYGIHLPSVDADAYLLRESLQVAKGEAWRIADRRTAEGIDPGKGGEMSAKVLRTGIAQRRLQSLVGGDARPGEVGVEEKQGEYGRGQQTG